jgi:NitT/TauT family transport system substrate-binding protein
MIRYLLAVPLARVKHLGALALACICSAWSVSALAELNEVSLARQFGDSYLPLMLMERQKLIEKHAQKLGLADVKAIWKEVSGGNAANDALLSGNLHFVSGGLGPLLQAWSASAGRIKGVAALNTMPLLLNTNNPNVKSIRDFTDKDRIAVPAVRVSMQSVVLRMAAAKEFGEKDFDRLDRLTVTMTQADATAALLTGSVGITSHFGNSPFQFQQLEDSKVRTVLNSYDVLGGPQTFGVVWTTAKFREENPTLYKAVLAALTEATQIINSDKKAAAELYVDMARSKLPVEFIHKIITNPQVSYSLAPLNTLKLAQFMHKVGQIKAEPKSWKDYFFPEIHALPGT